MARKKTELKHTVRANLNVVELTKAGTSLDLEIFANRQKIGTVVIGRGSIRWWGKGRQRSKKISWSRFAEMMDELAYAPPKKAESKSNPAFRKPQQPDAVLAAVVDKKALPRNEVTKKNGVQAITAGSGPILLNRLIANLEIID